MPLWGAEEGHCRDTLPKFSIREKLLSSVASENLKKPLGDVSSLSTAEILTITYKEGGGQSFQ